MKEIKKYWWLLLLLIWFIFNKKKPNNTTNEVQTLGEGDKNNDVLKLQQWINKRLSSGHIKEDSIYGQKTGGGLYVILEQKGKLDDNYIRVDNGFFGPYVSEIQHEWLYKTIK